MADRYINLVDFSGGIRNNRVNPLAAPPNILLDGSNVITSDYGVKSRKGYEVLGGVGAWEAEPGYRVYITFEQNVTVDGSSGDFTDLTGRQTAGFSDWDDAYLTEHIFGEDIGGGEENISGLGCLRYRRSDFGAFTVDGVMWVGGTQDDFILGGEDGEDWEISIWLKPDTSGLEEDTGLRIYSVKESTTNRVSTYCYEGDSAGIVGTNITTSLSDDLTTEYIKSGIFPWEDTESEDADADSKKKSLEGVTPTDNGSTITIDCTNTYSSGDWVCIYGTESYDGVYELDSRTSSTFTITTSDVNGGDYVAETFGENAGVFKYEHDPSWVRVLLQWTGSAGAEGRYTQTVYDRWGNVLKKKTLDKANVIDPDSLHTHTLELFGNVTPPGIASAYWTGYFDEFYIKWGTTDPFADGPTKLQQVRFPTNEVSYMVCQSGTELYVADDNLPGSLVFRPLYSLGSGAGTVDIAVLNDRAVITEGVAEEPLVFSGGLGDEDTPDPSDWPHPDAVLMSRNGTWVYDVTAEVCDKDDDQTVNIGGATADGYLLIGVDVPKVEAFHFDMSVVNTGGTDPGVRTNTCELDALADVTLEDLRSGITRWRTDGGDTNTGHFEGEIKYLDNGESAADPEGPGSTTVLMPCTGHGFVDGDVIVISGTSNYDGTYTLPPQTDGGTNDLFEISSEFYTEEFDGTEEVYQKVTLGTDNAAPLVEVGCTVLAGSGTYSVKITDITGDGEAANEVELSGNIPDDTAVDAIYGLMFDSGLQPSRSGDETLAPYDITLSDPGGPYGDYSIRHVVDGGGSLSFDYLRATFTVVERDEYPRLSGTKVDNVSIGKRDSDEATTDTPQELLFSGSSGFEITGAGSITSDWLAPSWGSPSSGDDHICVIDFAPKYYTSTG